MQHKINRANNTDWNGKQLWRNPTDNRIYATDGAPT